MPKFRCHLPRKGGNDTEAKQTKDGWDATFVFDGDVAPKGMVCKVMVPKAKAVAGVALPKAATAPATEQPAVEQPKAAPEQPKAVSDAVPTEAETEAVVEVPTGRPADFPSPAGPQSVSNPSGGFAEFVLLATATAVAGAMLSSSLSKPSDAKVKSAKQVQKGKAKPSQSRLEQHQQQLRERGEKERKDCGASTEAVKEEAKKDEQKFDAVLAGVSSLLQRLKELDENPTTEDIEAAIGQLSRRIARLEARRQVTSKDDNEPRTARRRRQTPDPHEKPDAGKAPRLRRT